MRFIGRLDDIIDTATMDESAWIELEVHQGVAPSPMLQEALRRYEAAEEAPNAYQRTVSSGIIAEEDLIAFGNLFCGLLQEEWRAKRRFMVDGDIRHLDQAITLHMDLSGVLVAMMAHILEPNPSYPADKHLSANQLRALYPDAFETSITIQYIDEVTDILEDARIEKATSVVSSNPILLEMRKNGRWQDFTAWIESCPAAGDGSVRYDDLPKYAQQAIDKTLAEISQRESSSPTLAAGLIAALASQLKGCNLNPK